MSIAYGGIIAFLFRGLNLAVAFGTVLFTSQQLEAGDYGVLVLGITVVGFANAATGGLTAATAYQIANQRKRPAAVLVNGAVIALAVGAIGLVAGSVGSATLSGDAQQVALPVAIAATAVVLNGVVAGSFLGRDAFIRYNLALVIPPLFALIAVAVAFIGFDERNPEAALAAYAGGMCLAFLVLLLMGGRALVAGARLDRKIILAVLSFALLAGISQGVSYLNYRADLFVVRQFEGEEGVAIYSLAVYLAESLWQVSGSLALATYARIGALSRQDAAELTTRVMRHTIVILGVICLVLLAVAGLIETLLFEKYAGMASALRLILPGVLVYGLAQSFAAFYTYQRGMPWVSALVAGTGLIVDIALAFALVPVMGVNGAALASSIAYSVAMLIALAAFLRSEHLSPASVFSFGRAELADYRLLIARLSSAIGR